MIGVDLSPRRAEKTAFGGFDASHFEGQIYSGENRRHMLLSAKDSDTYTVKFEDHKVPPGNGIVNSDLQE